MDRALGVDHHVRMDRREPKAEAFLLLRGHEELPDPVDEAVGEPGRRDVPLELVERVQDRKSVVILHVDHHDLPDGIQVHLHGTERVVPAPAAVLGLHEGLDEGAFRGGMDDAAVFRIRNEEVAVFVDIQALGGIQAQVRVRAGRHQEVPVPVKLQDPVVAGIENIQVVLPVDEQVPGIGQRPGGLSEIDPNPCRLVRGGHGDPAAGGRIEDVIVVFIGRHLPACRQQAGEHDRHRGQAGDGFAHRHAFLRQPFRPE